MFVVVVVAAAGVDPGVLRGADAITIRGRPETPLTRICLSILFIDNSVFADSVTLFGPRFGAACVCVCVFMRV